MNTIDHYLLKLNQTSKKSVGLYHKYAKAANLSDSALGILYALYLSGEPCSQYDLCSQWAIPKQTINTTVGALQKKGLVSLSSAAGARNKKFVTLTEAGIFFAQNVAGALCRAEHAAFETLTEEEQQLYTFLNDKYNTALIHHVNGILNGQSRLRGK